VKTLTFAGECGVGGGSCFQSGYRLILTCVFWPGWTDANPSPDQHQWGWFQACLGAYELENNFI